MIDRSTFRNVAESDVCLQSMYVCNQVLVDLLRSSLAITLVNLLLLLLFFSLLLLYILKTNHQKSRLQHFYNIKKNMPIGCFFFKSTRSKNVFRFICRWLNSTLMYYMSLHIARLNITVKRKQTL